MLRVVADVVDHSSGPSSVHSGSLSDRRLPRLLSLLVRRVVSPIFNASVGRQTLRIARA